MGKTQRTMFPLESGGPKTMLNSQTHQFIDYTQRNPYNWLTHPFSEPEPPLTLNPIEWAASKAKRKAYELLAEKGTGADPTSLGNKTGTVNMVAYMKWLRDHGYCFAGDGCDKEK
jgi:hypothetical protein